MQPFSDIAIIFTHPVWPVNLYTLPLTPFPLYIFTKLSLPPTTINSHSMLYSTHNIKQSNSTLSISHPLYSHIIILLSNDTDNIFPYINLILVIPKLCPQSTFICSNLLMFHILIVLSYDPDIISLLSSLINTQLTIS